MPAIYLLVMIALQVSTLFARQPYQIISNSSDNSITDSSSVASSRLMSKALQGGDEPNIQYAVHSQGNLQMLITNFGTLGYGHEPGFVQRDPITGERVWGTVFPNNSGLHYNLGLELLIGGVVDGDTLVAAGEFRPDKFPNGQFNYQSLDKSRTIYSDSARAQLDLTCVYYDTIPHVIEANSWFFCDRRDGPGGNFLNIPLNIKVTQRSMAWSGVDLGDFIIFDFIVEPMGGKVIEDAYVGFAIGGDVRHESRIGILDEYNQSYFGFLQDYVIDQQCSVPDRVNVAYIMDNDGDPVDGNFDYRSPLGAMGLIFLGAPLDEVKVNFNWFGWNYIGSDTSLRWWQPQKRPTAGQSLLDFRDCNFGYPGKDTYSYALLARREIDYDQMTTALNHALSGWLPPPANALEIALGDNMMGVLSFGPFDLGPGRKFPFSIAVVAGDSVHTDPLAYEHLFDPYNPAPFYNQLDFTKLAKASRWARWVYDNPGFDSDGDGYRGEFRICNGDTLWYSGDGIPDFRANVSPPSPLVRVIPSVGSLIVRWNGYYSETSEDPFSHIQDFEGYRVYAGLDDRKSSFTIMSSFDYHNYDRWRYLQLADGRYEWLNTEQPFTLDSLRQIYNDSTFEPLDFTRQRPLNYNGEFFFFVEQNFNRSSLTEPNGIHKVYPNATNPGTDSSLWTDNDVTMEHGDPLPKFYEYEYVYDNLLPTVPYYISVTSLDFGFAAGGIPSMESEIKASDQVSYAMTSSETVVANNLDAYVYPNPYRTDADYEGRGYEDRGSNMIPDRARRIHFSNLPNRCNIYVYSIDGDLIWSTSHDFPKDSPEGMHDIFPLVSRNYQAVESGLYYWVVESETRTQIGKLVIIR